MIGKIINLIGKVVGKIINLRYNFVGKDLRFVGKEIIKEVFSLAIITRTRNGVKYLYESKYVGFIDGKTKHKETCLGKLDENGNLIPSKKKSAQSDERHSNENNHKDNRNENNHETNENKTLSLMFNGKAITALGRAKGGGRTKPEQPQITTVDGVNLFSPDSVQKVGVGAAKIYRYAVAEFTKQNSNKITKERINPRLLFDIRDFASANGVDTNSESAMKNFRFKLRKSLETLRYTGITWTEKIKGKPKSYIGMNYIGKYELTNNSLMIEFTLSMAEYLVQLPLIQYPRSLYRLDDRDYNAFSIGEAMCIHYSQDNNVIRHTAGKLKVETLLKYTSFPSYEELKKNRWSWEAHVKERFENTLDKLTQCGVLKNWQYCYSGGIPITDEDIRADVIDSYEKYISLLVEYELNDYKDTQTRAVEIAKKKAESIKQLKQRKPKKQKAEN